MSRFRTLVQASAAPALATSERASSAAQLKSAGELRSTLRARGLNTVYQPIIGLDSGTIVGMEALARWTTPSGASISPDVFIPMAEENGLIGQLGSQILATAARDAAGWQSNGPVQVRVNVSLQEIRARSFYDETMRAVDKVDLDAHLLGIELAEGVLREDEDVTANLRQLHAAGVSLMLDDRGEGYTALHLLEDLPVVDRIKIDRSFLAHPSGDAQVHAVLDLGRAYGLKVCAEGVENAAQHSKVRDLGCDVAQGYYFARPTSRELVTTMLRAWAPFLPL